MMFGLAHLIERRVRRDKLIWDLGVVQWNGSRELWGLVVVVVWGDVSFSRCVENG